MRYRIIHAMIYTIIEQKQYGHKSSKTITYIIMKTTN